MPIPISTTTISILRIKDANVYTEPYENTQESDRDVVATGIRAVISGTGSEMTRGGEQVSAGLQLNADPCDLNHLDWIEDETTNQVYRVSYVNTLAAFGLDHLEASLTQVIGLP